MNDREKIATLICLGTDDSCKEHCNLPSGKVCVRCETLADCLVAHGVTIERHGQWVEKPTGAYGRWQSWCSVCEKHSGIGGIESNRHKAYCPNCGAKMGVQ